MKSGDLTFPRLCLRSLRGQTGHKSHEQQINQQEQRGFNSLCRCKSTNRLCWFVLITFLFVNVICSPLWYCRLEAHVPSLQNWSCNNALLNLFLLSQTRVTRLVLCNASYALFMCIGMRPISPNATRRREKTALCVPLTGCARVGNKDYQRLAVYHVRGAARLKCSVSLINTRLFPHHERVCFRFPLQTDCNFVSPICLAIQ